MDTKYRKVFSQCHRLIGVSLITLAMITCYFGLQKYNLSHSDGSPKTQFLVVILAFVVIGFSLVAFVLHRRVEKKHALQIGVVSNIQFSDDIDEQQEYNLDQSLSEAQKKSNSNSRNSQDGDVFVETYDIPLGLRSSLMLSVYRIYCATVILIGLLIIIDMFINFTG